LLDRLRLFPFPEHQPCGYVASPSFVSCIIAPCGAMNRSASFAAHWSLLTLERVFQGWQAKSIDRGEDVLIPRSVRDINTDVAVPLRAVWREDDDRGLRHLAMVIPNAKRLENGGSARSGQFGKRQRERIRHARNSSGVIRDGRRDMYALRFAYSAYSRPSRPTDRCGMVASRAGTRQEYPRDGGTPH
jgi:hypothetical protein